jgi:hypothetical protein
LDLLFLLKNNTAELGYLLLQKMKQFRDDFQKKVNDGKAAAKAAKKAKAEEVKANKLARKAEEETNSDLSTETEENNE